MSLWGTSDSVYSTGNVTTITTAGVITGNGTTWTTGNGVVPGLVITMGTKGSGVIKSVDSATQITLASASGITAGSGLTQSYNINAAPKSTVVDTNYDGNEIFGVSQAEQLAAVDDGSQYKPAHAGWVGISSYTDMHGNIRVKTETLVVGNFITGDANDDTILPDN